ncbi:hypothetical protein CC80DRAFT_131718 [Byssothecium circinans]|uniref:Uncharacterized protein n=1 Tax=Byssothecium circinans TaxID=147558 RepID=A0A6A5TY08_9PLEO|nr:hypothetical protein CC80DRAFT_131718 [Byssothecium circinans]
MSIQKPPPACYESQALHILALLYLSSSRLFSAVYHPKSSATCRQRRQARLD